MTWCNWRGFCRSRKLWSTNVRDFFGNSMPLFANFFWLNAWRLSSKVATRRNILTQSPPPEQFNFNAYFLQTLGGDDQYALLPAHSPESNPFDGSVHANCVHPQLVHVQMDFVGQNDQNAAILFWLIIELFNVHNVLIKLHGILATTFQTEEDQTTPTSRKNQLWI